MNVPPPPPAPAMAPLAQVPPPKSGISMGAVAVAAVAAACLYGWWTRREEERTANAKAARLETELEGYAGVEEGAFPAANAPGDRATVYVVAAGERTR